MMCKLSDWWQMILNTAQIFGVTLLIEQEEQESEPDPEHGRCHIYPGSLRSTFTYGGIEDEEKEDNDMVLRRHIWSADLSREQYTIFANAWGFDDPLQIPQEDFSIDQITTRIGDRLDLGIEHEDIDYIKVLVTPLLSELSDEQLLLVTEAVAGGVSERNWKVSFFSSIGICVEGNHDDTTEIPTTGANH